MTTANKEVSIPRWHYRETQGEVLGILENAQSIGSLRGAMVEYIHARKERLPEGMTAESAVASILQTVDGFVAAHEEGKTSDDIREALRETIAKMDSKQAVAYLATLEAMFRSCDVAAVNGGELPDVEKLQQDLATAVESGSDEDIVIRLERLAEAIQGDSLKSYIYASGNAEIAELIRGDAEITASTISTETAEKIHATLLDDAQKAKVYAATACACYGTVLDGKIQGMTAANLDAGVLTSLVVAGLEKATILSRLARGEIDEELARDMLSALARTLKWMLVKALQVGIFLVASEVSVFALASICGLVSVALPAGFLLAAGCILGLSFAMDSKEPIETVVNFLGTMTKWALGCVTTAVSWIWDRAKATLGLGKNVQGTPQRGSLNTAKATATN